MKKTIIIFALIFALLACNKKIENPYSPEPLPPPPLPRAEIVISTSINPIIFYWNWNTLIYYGVFTVNIAETNGVGANISLIECAFYLSGQTYSPVTAPSARLNANSSISAPFSGGTPLAIYPQIRILVKGQDDNGYQIDKSAFFNVVYY